MTIDELIKLISDLNYFIPSEMCVDRSISRIMISKYTSTISSKKELYIKYINECIENRLIFFIKFNTDNNETISKIVNFTADEIILIDADDFLECKISEYEMYMMKNYILMEKI